MIHVAHLTPPRSYYIGEERVDYILPAAVIGARRAPIVVARAGGDIGVALLSTMSPCGLIELPGGPAQTAAEVIAAGRTEPLPELAGARLLALPPGSKAALEVGPFELAIEVGDAVRVPTGRFRIGKRVLPLHAASIALHAGALVALRLLSSAIAKDDDEVVKEQIAMMRHLLVAAAEKETDELSAATKGDDGAGSAGTARGEAKAKGPAATSVRYGIKGARSSYDPYSVRTAMLRDAASFGMVGLMNPTADDGVATDPPEASVEGEESASFGNGSHEIAGPGAPEEIDGVPDMENYTDYGVNPVVDPGVDRVSTFAIDVDTGSYAIARRRLLEGSLPSRGAVRAEEFLNSFDYGYEGPEADAEAEEQQAAEERPFTVHLAAAPSPFTKGHHLLRVGVQGRRIEPKDRKPVHLVYLVDTSGSMQSPDRIGLAKGSLRLLTGTLRPGDTVALCTYAGSVREVLPPTKVEHTKRILHAIDDLTAEGSTAMESGIDLAYQLAERTRVPGEVNRVIILSDGDANVGATSHEEILGTIRRYRDKGITLSTVGFGRGNYNDTMMERLADNGNGNYSYIDSEREARRVFAAQANGMLEVIARDVKIQVEFNPTVVKEYRLVGYENRDVEDSKFRDDTVDGGEIGAGHSVTAVYDIVLRPTSGSPVTVRLRHKTPFGSEAEAAFESAFVMDASSVERSFTGADANFRFAAAVMGFAEILRESPYATAWSLANVERVARAAADDSPEQAEFVDLVRVAKVLSSEREKAAERR